MHNGAAQRWRVVYTDSAEAKAAIKKHGLNRNFGFHINKPFYIISRMYLGRVLEVVGGRNIVIRTRANRATQQFTFDGRTKTIQCIAYKGQSFDIQNYGRSTNVQIWKTSARWF